ALAVVDRVDEALDDLRRVRLHLLDQRLLLAAAPEADPGPEQEAGRAGHEREARGPPERGGGARRLERGRERGVPGREPGHGLRVLARVAALAPGPRRIGPAVV